MKITVTLANGMTFSQEALLKKIVFEADPTGEVVPPIEVEFRGGPVVVQVDPKTGASLTLHGKLEPFLILGGDDEVSLEKARQAIAKGPVDMPPFLIPGNKAPALKSSDE